MSQSKKPAKPKANSDEAIQKEMEAMLAKGKDEDWVEEFDYWSDHVSDLRDGIVPDMAAYSPDFPEKLSAVIGFAAAKHGRQARKGTMIYYVSHPMMVAALVMEHGGSESEVYAAVLHDVVEDTDTSLAEIESKFGAEVAAIVKDCSDSLSHTNKKPWRERKESYLRHLEEAPLQSLLVSLADKTHNARSIVRDVRNQGKDVWDRFNAKPIDIVWYYKSLLEVFTKRAPEHLDGFHALVAELKYAVDEMSRQVP